MERQNSGASRVGISLLEIGALVLQIVLQDADADSTPVAAFSTVIRITA